MQATDAVASDQEIQSIAQRFQSAGVNVVIGVGGSGSTTWPRAQLDNQSTYKPTYIATSESSLISYVESAKGANPYLEYVLAASSAPTFYQQWKDPAIQKCVADVHKAYPSDTITPPVNPTSPGAGNSTDTTYESVVEACQYLGCSTRSPTAAGKNLTVASFTKAGYALKNAAIPGLGTGLVRTGPALRHRPGDHLQVRPHERDARACVKLWDEMTLAGPPAARRRTVSGHARRWGRARGSGLR